MGWWDQLTSPRRQICQAPLALFLGPAPDRHRQPAIAPPETNEALTSIERSGIPLLSPGNAGPSTFNGIRIAS